MVGENKKGEFGGVKLDKGIEFLEGHPYGFLFLTDAHPSDLLKVYNSLASRGIHPSCRRSGRDNLILMECVSPEEKKAKSAK